MIISRRPVAANPRAARGITSKTLLANIRWEGSHARTKRCVFAGSERWLLPSSEVASPRTTGASKAFAWVVAIGIIPATGLPARSYTTTVARTVGAAVPFGEDSRAFGGGELAGSILHACSASAAATAQRFTGCWALRKARIARSTTAGRDRPSPSRSGDCPPPQPVRRR